jgi:hypothetical protein
MPKHAERENVFPAFYRKVPLGWQPLRYGFEVVRAFLETVGVGCWFFTVAGFLLLPGKTFTVMRFSRHSESYRYRIVWSRLSVFDSRRNCGILLKVQAITIALRLASA